MSIDPTNVNSYVGSRYAAAPVRPVQTGVPVTNSADQARLDNIAKAKANTVNGVNEFEQKRFAYNQAHQQLGTGNMMNADGHIWNVASAPKETQVQTTPRMFGADYASAGTGPAGTIQYPGADGRTVNAGVGAHTAGLQTDVYGNPNNLASTGQTTRPSFLPSIPNFTPAAPLATVPPAPRYVPEAGLPVLATPTPAAPQINTDPMAAHSTFSRYLAGVLTSNSVAGAIGRFGLRNMTGFGH